MIMIRASGDEGSTTRFAPGDLVRHRRGYRGVVVELDPRCCAPDEWYRSNPTQPARDQPWYHVLVDRSHHTTYVAEQNLMPDPSGAEVLHPLLGEFFEAFQDGRYVRNERSWGAW